MQISKIGGQRYPIRQTTARPQKMLREGRETCSIVQGSFRVPGNSKKNENRRFSKKDLFLQFCTFCGSFLRIHLICRDAAILLAKVVNKILEQKLEIFSGTLLGTLLGRYLEH